MNKIRRKALSNLVDDLNAIKDALEELQAEEEEYRDNIPENLQGSDRYFTADECCVNMEEAASQLDDAIALIETVIEA